MQSRLYLLALGLVASSAVAEELSTDHQLGVNAGYSQSGSGNDGAKTTNLEGNYSFRRDNFIGVEARGATSLYGKTANLDASTTAAMVLGGYRYVNAEMPALAVTPLAGFAYEENSFSGTTQIPVILGATLPVQIKATDSQFTTVVGGQVDYRILPALEAGIQARLHVSLSRQGEAKVVGQSFGARGDGSSTFYALEVPVSYAVNQQLQANSAYEYVSAPNRHTFKAGLGYKF